MSGTMTLCPGALMNQTAFSGWIPMCLSCFSPSLPWYKYETQSEEDGILKE